MAKKRKHATNMFGRKRLKDRAIKEAIVDDFFRVDDAPLLGKDIAAGDEDGPVDIKPDNSVFYTFNKGTVDNILSGDIPSPVKLEAPPTISWTGKKMSFKLWGQILAWMKRHNNIETLVQLLYTPTEGITVFIPPQHGNPAACSTRLTTAFAKKLKTHTHLGNIHSHPTFTASASCIDRNDERTAGVYFTVGNLDSQICSLHSRVVLSGYVFNNCPKLEDFIEIPEEFKEYADVFLLQLVKLPDYPVEWDKQMDRVPESFAGRSAFTDDIVPVGAGRSSCGAGVDGWAYDPDTGRYYVPEDRLDKRATGVGVQSAYERSVVESNKRLD